MAWAIERRHEDAATFHARALPDPAHRSVWRCEPPRPALVLGSAQRDEVVDWSACEDAGVDVVRRRSGGGAVLVERSLLWVDVVLSARDSLWDHDVGRAALWLGATWADALASVGIVARVHAGPLQRTRWSSLVCFGGLAPGELTDDEGRKVLGISQRRTRAGARFQCAAIGAWDAAALLRLLALTPRDREAAGADLASVAAGLDVPLEDLFEAFLRQLP